MSQRDLGNLLNVTHVSISGYENETRSPDPYVLSRIAEIFNVSVDDLVGKKHPNSCDLKLLLKEDNVTYNGKQIPNENLELIAEIIEILLRNMDN
ncbi:helix-turn-helix transcriptional regulator [Aerococcus mictus]|nr:helix-turn-helix transcriptional regulator [Aerococcus mictus]